MVTAKYEYDETVTVERSNQRVTLEMSEHEARLLAGALSHSFDDTTGSCYFAIKKAITGKGYGEGSVTWNSEYNEKFSGMIYYNGENN